MRWPWKLRKANGHAEDVRGLYPGAFNWTPTKEQLLERIERFERMAEGKRELPEPNFIGSLIMAIELLKRGATVVDMHEWNIRLRKTGDTWGISSVPVFAREIHAGLELNDQLSSTQEPPIDGDEVTNGDGGTTTAEVGPAPENA